MQEPKDTSHLSDEENLSGLLERREPRFFRAGKGKARGESGTKDIEVFIENLGLLQACALGMGDQLEMDTVSYCVVHEKDATLAYRYDANSDSKEPVVVGAMVNRHMPTRELLLEMSDR
jgi:hypothetical protein